MNALSYILLTACKMTSQWRYLAWAVSAKNTLFIVLCFSIIQLITVYSYSVSLKKRFSMKLKNIYHILSWIQFQTTVLKWENRQTQEIIFLDLVSFHLKWCQSTTSWHLCNHSLSFFSHLMFKIALGSTLSNMFNRLLLWNGVLVFY